MLALGNNTIKLSSDKAKRLRPTAWNTELSPSESTNSDEMHEPLAPGHVDRLTRRFDRQSVMRVHNCQRSAYWSHFVIGI